MEKLILKWNITYSRVKTVVLSSKEVVILTGRSVYKFPRKGNAIVIQKLISNIPESKIKDDSDCYFDDIIDSVCKVYKQERECVYLHTRKREIVQTRQICMALSKLKTNKSLEDIGRHYGNYDHATVLHSIKTVRNLLDTNKVYREDVGHLFEGVVWPHIKN